ncbi:MAG TPA: tetratricopeptide repeat protein [Ktedonobacteraceae bacterium]|nr:tetratricopeptide repeat protein [Ktedonobacteraceae bacterium]
MNVHQMTSQEPPKRKYTPSIRNIIFVIGCILILLAALVWILSIGNVISGLWAIILPVVFVVLGVIFTFGQFLAAVSPNISHQSNTSSLSQPIHVSVTIPPPALSPASINTPEPIEPQDNTKPIWYIPYRRNPFFTGREQLLKQLHTNLIQNTSAALTQAQAINGLGGIGKTQIAVEYAYTYRDDYHFVFWINAASLETLFNSFTTIADKLHLPVLDRQDQQHIVSLVHQWIASHQDCLLIFDNADELSLLNDFFPVEYTCHILITTRQHSLGSLAQPVEVKPMNTDEGLHLLLHRARLITQETPLVQVSQEEQETAKQIVQALGALPLALDQAGAYIEETGCTLTFYLNTYKSRQSDLLAYRGKDTQYHHDPVATTWRLNFEQVQQDDPRAADLMNCCAFLAPDDIPEELFTQRAHELSPFLQSFVTDSSLLNDALGKLLDFSLIRRDKGTFSIHRLVQASLKNSMDKATQQVWAERTIYMVNHVFPGNIDVTTWKQCQQYITHAQTCATWIETFHLAFPEAAALLNKAGYYLYDLAFYADAEPLYQRALQIREQVLGPQHPSTATSLNNLAALYDTQGKYEQAKPLYQRALRISEQVLGPQHPDTAQSLNNLALLYQSQGKYEQAEPLLKRALQISEQVLDPQHPDTAQSLNNLALLYDNQGKYEQAEPLYQRALRIREQVLGPQHPSTATSLNNLAALYDTQGKYEQAEPLYQRALQISEQVLGPQHPDTAQSLNNLAALYKSQGKYEQAEPLYQRAVAIMEKMLGSNHPNTITVRKNYTVFLEDKKQRHVGKPEN